MEVRKYLEQVKVKDVELQNLQVNLNELRDMMFSLGGAPDGERVRTSRNNDKLGTLYAKVDLMERKIESRMAELAAFKIKVTEEINALGNCRYMRVLCCRYIRYMSWDQIAEEAFKNPLTSRQILRIHEKALAAFQNVHHEMLSDLQETM